MAKNPVKRGRLITISTCWLISRDILVLLERRSVRTGIIEGI